MPLSSVMLDKLPNYILQSNDLFELSDIYYIVEMLMPGNTIGKRAFNRIRWISELSENEILDRLNAHKPPDAEIKLRLKSLKKKIELYDETKVFKPLIKIDANFFNLSELNAPWEEDFYLSAWSPETLKLTQFEASLIEDITDFLPRHMKIYDWNLPYAEAILLRIRRKVAEATCQP
jgi:hypothetical protein